MGSLPDQVITGLEHLVGCLDRLGAELVGALCLDQVDHFLHDIDVGLFQRAADQLAAPK